MMRLVPPQKGGSGQEVVGSSIGQKPKMVRDQGLGREMLNVGLAAF